MSSLRPTSVPPFADFEQKCCAHFGLPADRYLDLVLRRMLYPHARVLRPLLLLLDPDFFSADREFLAGVGQLWRRRDFLIEVKDFHYNPANRGFLRRTLRLRVSVGRVQALVHTLLTDPPPDDIVFLRAPDVDAAPMA